MKLSDINNKNRVFLFIIDISGCGLFLFSSFTNYIFYIGYDRVVPDLLACFGVLFAVAIVLAVILNVCVSVVRTIIFSILVLIALGDAVYAFGTSGGGVWLHIIILTMFSTFLCVFLLRAHINKILIVVFSSMLLSTIALHATEKVIDVKSRMTGHVGLPVVVHLVLDEYMGTGGMTARLPAGERINQQVTSFFVDNGFRLFSNAHSEYFNTHASLASAMNVSSIVSIEKLAYKQRNKYIMTANRYLSEWTKKGYKINVLQSSYLDFCASQDVLIETCETYSHDGFDARAIASLPLTERLKLIGRMYYSSFTLIRLLQLSAHALDPEALYGSYLWHGRVGPLAAIGPLRRLIDKVEQSHGGEMFFAHLLMPHYPYVLESDCRVRTPVSSWKLRLGEGGVNSVEQRKAAYKDYFEQMRCVMQMIQPLFDAMRAHGTFDNAIIIIHGDHGSRISRIEPVASSAADMTADDFVDGFSTLFALKAPDTAPGIELRKASLPELLTYAVGHNKQVMPDNTSPHVFLSDPANGYIEVPYKAIPQKEN